MQVLDRLVHKGSFGDGVRAGEVNRLLCVMHHAMHHAMHYVMRYVMPR